MIDEDAYFRVLEQFQFWAHLCGNGIPLQIDGTTKWDCSSASSMGLN